jgi:molybdopterin-guanine dinucleotide biosynthesis protein A
MRRDVSCIILAGGTSRRMGQDKAFIQVGGIRLFDYVYGTCRELFSEIIIVTNQPHHFIDYNPPIVTDEIPGSGSLGGLYTGLKRASNEYSLCVACDMPFLNPELITYVIDKRLTSDVVIPRTTEGLQPLHAVYSKRCIDPIKKCLERADLKIPIFFPDVQVTYCEEEEIKRIDPALISFMNVNTRQDLFQIQKMLHGVPWTQKQKAI